MAAEDDARPTKQNGGSYPAASNSVIAGLGPYGYIAAMHALAQMKEKG